MAAFILVAEHTFFWISRTICPTQLTVYVTAMIVTSQKLLSLSGCCDVLIMSGIPVYGPSDLHLCTNTETASTRNHHVTDYAYACQDTKRIILVYHHNHHSNTYALMCYHLRQTNVMATVVACRGTAWS